MPDAHDVTETSICRAAIQCGPTRRHLMNKYVTRSRRPSRTICFDGDQTQLPPNKHFQSFPLQVSNMSVSALDSRVFRNLFGTQEIRDVFTDEAYVRRMIETEAALARAQSKVGIIPAEAGEKLTKALNAAKIEYETHNQNVLALSTPGRRKK